MQHIQDTSMYALPLGLKNATVVARGVLSICALYVLTLLPGDYKKWKARKNDPLAELKFAPTFLPFTIISVAILFFMPRAFDQLLPYVSFDMVLENSLTLVGLLLMITYFITGMGVRLYMYGAGKREIIHRIGAYVVGLSLLAVVGSVSL